MVSGVSSSPKKNIALVGVGMVAKTHLLAIADLKHKLNLVGVCAGSQETATQFSEEAAAVLNCPVRVFGDISEIAADDQIEFTIVLTPPNARREIVEALAKSGKHILMEKPVERTVDAASDIVSMCSAHNVQLGIVFQHRIRDSSQKLRSLIEANTLGKLCSVDAQIPWWREQSYYDEPGRGSYARDGGGVLISQAIHTLDLMLSLTGPAKEVQAMARTTSQHVMESEDYVTAGVYFENEAVGSVIASTASYPGGAESITFQFENAAALLRSGELKIYWRDGREETFGETSATGGGADPMAFTHDWHRAIIEDFADALDEGRKPICTGREALEVHHLIDAITRSSDEKRAVSVSRVSAI